MIVEWHTNAQLSEFLAKASQTQRSTGVTESAGRRPKASRRDGPHRAPPVRFSPKREAASQGRTGGRLLCSCRH